MKHRHLAWLAVGLAVSSGAMELARASEREPLALKFTAASKEFSTDPRSFGSPPPVPLPRLDGCSMPVGVTDARMNRRSVGAIFRMPSGDLAVPDGATSVIAENGQRWLAEAVSTLTSAGHAPSEPAEGGPAVELALRLAHVWQDRGTLESHVVLQAQWRRPDGTRLVRRYHGMASKDDLLARAPTILLTLNMGMTEALRQFAGDLQRACAGTLH